MKSLEEIKAEFDRIATLIGCSPYAQELNAFQKRTNDYRTFGLVRIDVDEQGYHYFYSENGRECEFAVTTNFDKILYWTFKRPVASVAWEYALKRAIPGSDRRQLCHSYGGQLFGKFSAYGKERWKADIALSLTAYPYEHYYDSRIAFHRDNLIQGIPGEESWRMALVKFPAETARQRLRPF